MSEHPLDAWKNAPDFIIVGAMKSGTTSLAYHLRRHDKIWMPDREVHFFDRERNFRRGMNWYIDSLLRDCTRNFELLGEKTPTYSYQEDVAKRMYQLVPSVKLIWIFREPVRRAYSNYLHAVREGAIHMSFESAIAREKELIQRNIFFGYLERSRYYKQVERYLEYFPQSSMHFMLFEGLVSDTRRQLERLFRFLGLSSDGYRHSEEHRGRTVVPRSPSLSWWTRRLFGRGLIFGTVRSANAFMKKPGYPRLSEETVRRLERVFEADNRRLASLTSLDLSVWTSG